MDLNKKVAVGLIFLMTSGVAFAMGKMCLFSAVSGVVVKDGAPIKDAVVKREFNWGWKNETGQDETKTDAEGKFRFPAIVRSSFLGSLLPHEPMIRQTILIQWNSQTFRAWMFDKGNYDDNGELKGKPIAIHCDLDAPLAHQGEVYGICKLL